jgi:uncharacterized protein YycO
MQKNRKLFNLSTKKTVFATTWVVIFAGVFLFGILPAITAPVVVAKGSDDTASVPRVTSEPEVSFAADGTNTLAPTNLLPGDVLILGTKDTFFDYLIPGKYSHTELYCGTVQSGELIWDRDFHVWMPVGTHYVIHSTKGDNCGDGLGYSRWSEAVNNHADNVLVLRVMRGNGALLTASERQSVVNWAKSQLTGGVDGYPIGPQYDWGWLSKQIGVDSMWPAPAGYYCCELIWASYQAALGIDLDAETSPFDIAVTNDDLWHSQYTSVIAYECGNVKVTAPSDIVRLTVFVDEIYYDDDYDPWPKGAGEEYIISRSGLGNSDEEGNMLATEQSAPGCGKIGKTPDGSWSRDGSGALDWNKYFYSLVSVGQAMRIRVEAWEDDDIDGDDQYPVWQWYWSYSTWSAYKDAGWFWSGSRIDLGACRYTIWFKVETVY